MEKRILNDSVDGLGRADAEGTPSSESMLFPKKADEIRNADLRQSPQTAAA
jgi:hypothetical protein